MPAARRSSRQLRGVIKLSVSHMWLRKLRSQRLRDLGQGQARLSARPGCGLSALSHGEVAQLSLLPPNHLTDRPSPTNQAENKINSQPSFLLPTKRLKLLAGWGVHGERDWGIQKVVAHVCLGLCDPRSRSQTARRADGGKVTPVVVPSGKVWTPWTDLLLRPLPSPPRPHSQAWIPCTSARPGPPRS